jgi:hypothetical protein
MGINKWLDMKASHSVWELQRRSLGFITFSNALSIKNAFCYAEDRVMHVTLQKREKGQPWPSAIAGHAPLDPLKTEQEKQRLMLERFQEEVRSTWEGNADFSIFLCF